MIGWIVVIVACTVLLFFLGKGRPKVVPRLIALAAVVAVGAVSFFYVYLDDDRYNALAGDHAQKEVEAYAATGVVYPFPPQRGDYLEAYASYDAAAAQAILSQYEDGVIPEEKKVNLISIQLEAFADLSLYDIDGLPPTSTGVPRPPGGELHRHPHHRHLRRGAPRRPSGLSSPGGNRHGDFAYDTNSVAWYLKSQGYTANGSPPLPGLVLQPPDGEPQPGPG